MFYREDVFICNVLKHPPPSRRSPATDEIGAYGPLLPRQPQLPQLKVILDVGTIEAQTTDLRGEPDPIMRKAPE